MYLMLVLCFLMILREANGTVEKERNRERLFTSYDGYALEGSVTAVYQVDSPLQCASRFMRDSRFKSFNVKATNTQGKLRCELNNAKKSEKSSFYVNKVESTYYEAIETEPKKTNEKASHCSVVQEYNFTTLGASGRHGPTSIRNHNQGQRHQHQITLINGTQQWTVPITGQYRIEAVGATGGYDTYPNSALYRGFGARMIGTFTLNQDEVVQILVGQEGGIDIRYSSSGGGGGSFVARGSTPLIVAGGGGGINRASSRHPYCDAGTDTAGRRGYGRGSWPGGTEGRGATFANDSRTGGGGGGFYSDGRSGTNFGGSSSFGGEGGKGFLNGGTGGRSYTGKSPGGFGGGGGAYGSCCGGGGGGGGYSGGASGDNSHDSCRGGGGSYNAGTYQQNTCCVNDKGHGYVLVRQLSCFP